MPSDRDQHRGASLDRQSKETTPRSSRVRQPALNDNENPTVPRSERQQDYANPFFPREGDTRLRGVSPPRHHDHFATSTSQELSRRGRRFVAAAPFNDFQKSWQYVKDHDSVLDEDNKDSNYLAEAIAALQDGDKPFALNCVEKGIIRNACRDREWDEVRKYFALMIKKDAITLKDHESKFKKLWAIVESRASAPRHAQPAQRRSSTTSRASEERESDLATRTSRLTISDKPSSGIRHDPQYRSSREGEAFPHDRPSHDRHALDKIVEDTRDELTSEISRKISIRGPGEDANEEDKYDARFHQRFGKAAQKFWRIGQVFALQWYVEDTASRGAPSKVPPEELSDRRQKPKRGRDIVSKVLRLAVVRVGHGFVWAIPINTYSGQGMKKSGFNQADINAHAIIYDSSGRARPIEDEPPMRKLPIAVDLVRGQRLHPASRINFSKVHTVEQNVLAMDVGRVTEDSKPYFVPYWSEHLLG